MRTCRCCRSDTALGVSALDKAGRALLEDVLVRVGIFSRNQYLCLKRRWLPPLRRSSKVAAFMS